MKTLLPALYVNITEHCNMRCVYCPVYGENWEGTENQLLDMPTVLATLRVARAVGIETFRISGGEPMLFPERVFAVIAELNGMGVKDIILNTNGFNAHRYIDRLSACSLNKVKVSVDSLDAETFKTITNTPLLPEVLKSIDALRSSSIPLELNLVVTKTFLPEFWPLLEFCVTRNVSLKLLDLVQYDVLVRNPMAPEEYWKEEFVRLADLVPRLSERFGDPTMVRLSNDRGIPMWQFKIGSAATLTLKDSTLGSTYAQVCKSCSIFPCQEGLFHLSLSAEGNLTPCRLRRDLARSVRGLSEAELEDFFRQCLRAYDSPVLLSKTVDFPMSASS